MGYLDIYGNGISVQVQGRTNVRPTKTLFFENMYYDIILKHMPKSKESDTIKDLYDAKWWVVRHSP
jgi:hypothetical protein